MERTKNKLGSVSNLILGDSLEVLKTFPDNYCDSVVTDPP